MDMKTNSENRNAAHSAQINAETQMNAETASGLSGTVAGTGTPVVCAGSERNYGIDLLRIVSMFLIVNLHVLGQGGAMVRIRSHPSTYNVCWFLETCAYCAVDCYGLISGYVGAQSRFRVSRFLELWLQVFFYSAGIFLLYALFMPEVITVETIRTALLPVSFKAYWYFTAYAGVFFFTPYLNRMLDALSERELRGLFAVIFLVCSVATAVPKIFSSDTLSLVGGYTFVWILMLYLMGGCLRRISIKRRNRLVYPVIYFACVILSWGYKILMENYTRAKYGELRYGRLFTSYTAPTILLCAVCLLILFQSFELKGKIVRKLISVVAPLSFSVYLIHTHPLIFDNLIKNAFASFRNLPAGVVLFPVLLSALGIFILCCLIDWCRSRLWKLLHIRQLTDYIGDHLQNRM